MRYEQRWLMAKALGQAAPDTGDTTEPVAPPPVFIPVGAEDDSPGTKFKRGLLEFSKGLFFFVLGGVAVVLLEGEPPK